MLHIFLSPGLRVDPFFTHHHPGWDDLAELMSLYIDPCTNIAVRHISAVRRITEDEMLVQFCFADEEYVRRLLKLR
jgi:hypothetical protein